MSPGLLIREYSEDFLNNMSISDNLTKAYMHMLFTFIIPMFLASFLAFAFARYIAYKTKLYNIDGARDNAFQSRK